MIYPVSPQKIEALHKKMAMLGLRESDFEEKFLRSQGSGGQNVNKVSTCAWLKHVPTGLEVKCQKERSQALNRFLARRLLVGKIEALHRGAESEANRRIQKIRRQKRRRSRRAKEKMLETKRHRSGLKTLRRRPSAED